MQIVIAEDDDSVARFLSQAMHEAGHHTARASDGETALKLARGVPDLLLLDVTLPVLSGLEVCRLLRSEGVDLPILMLTARDTLADKVAGLDAGADDYLVKPFHLGELLARVRALLRRRPRPLAPLVVADLKLDPDTRQAQRGEHQIPLSATEYSLLEYLMRNAGRTLPRTMILDHVWGYDFEGRDNVLEVYVSYLRAKLDRHGPPMIRTVRGTGYRLESL